MSNISEMFNEDIPDLLNNTENTDGDRTVCKYVLSKNSMNTISYLPEIILGRCTLLRGLEILSGDVIEIGLVSDDMLEVSVVAGSIPLWGSCREFREYVPREDLPDLKDFLSEIDSLECSVLILNIENQGVRWLNKLIVEDGVRKIIIGDNSDAVSVKESWDFCNSLLDREESVPIEVSSFLVTLAEKLVGGLYPNVDLNSDSILLRYSKGGQDKVSFSIEGKDMYETGEIRICDGVPNKSDCWKDFIISLNEVLPSVSILEVKIGGNSWNRSECINASRVLKSEKGIKIVVTG